MDRACDACGQIIPAHVLAKRHISTKRESRLMFCNRSCLRDWRREHGFFQAMSFAGAEARSQALRTSNRENPRRGQRCKDCGKLLPPRKKRRGAKPLYCAKCVPWKRENRKEYTRQYYRAHHPCKRKRKDEPNREMLAQIPVSQVEDPRAYNRWYRRLVRSGKPVEYWLERDKEGEKE
jgi:hypothetical protein